MGESDERRPHRKRARLIVGVLVVLFGVYPLSIGPAYWLQGQGYYPGTVFLIAYRPLNWLADEVATIKRMLFWYLSLWE